MNWILTHLGVEYVFNDLENQRDQIRIEDIAHALSLINRYTGHACRPYSVAEHSLLCAQAAKDQGLTPIVQLAALLHDGHEAYTGDMASPIKREVGTTWEVFEVHEKIALRNHYRLRGVYAYHHAVLRRLDLQALATERRDITAFDASRHRAWPILDTPGREILPLDTDLNAPDRVAKPWTAWRDEFLLTFEDILRTCATAKEFGHA